MPFWRKENRDLGKSTKFSLRLYYIALKIVAPMIFDRIQ